MKIAITGHSAGIGKSLARVLESRGHHIVGLSKRDGDNIRVIPKIADKIQECDMFINNAQAGYAQTELLYEMWNRWQDQHKHIWVIGTIMSQQPVAPAEYIEYHNQKTALDHMVEQLRHRGSLPWITLIRPGGVATQGQTVGPSFCDPDAWCKLLVNTIITAENAGMRYSDLSLCGLHEVTGL